ncbi:hypothetical protein CDD83_9230 [Cordyceps sp. RAO-2017]|nr:hypothetical protein CDD83_9230 [Cordyceps sp. RAO-2017]
MWPAVRTNADDAAAAADDDDEEEDGRSYEEEEEEEGRGEGRVEAFGSTYAYASCRGVPGTCRMPGAPATEPVKCWPADFGHWPSGRGRRQRWWQRWWWWVVAVAARAPEVPATPWAPATISSGTGTLVGGHPAGRPRATALAPGAAQAVVVAVACTAGPTDASDRIRPTGGRSSTTMMARTKTSPGAMGVPDAAQDP